MILILVDSQREQWIPARSIAVLHARIGKRPCDLTGILVSFVREHIVSVGESWSVDPQ